VRGRQAEEAPEPLYGSATLVEHSQFARPTPARLYAVVSRCGSFQPGRTKWHV